MYIYIYVNIYIYVYIYIHQRWLFLKNDYAVLNTWGFSSGTEAAVYCNIIREIAEMTGYVYTASSACKVFWV